MQGTLAQAEFILSADGCDEIKLIGDECRHAWNQYVFSNSYHSVYHQYDWRDIMYRTFNTETYYLAAFCMGHIVGVLPLARMKSQMFGDFMVSLPYFNYGGVLASSDRIAFLLWQYATKLGERLGVSHIELRHTESVLPVSMVRKDKVSMILTLPSSSEELFKQLSSKLRSQIRRPQREGALTQVGGQEIIHDFYRVFSKNMRDLGTPVYPKSFFAAILEQFPQATRLIVVRLANKPVAAALLIGHNGRMEIPWASSLREFNHLSVNMQLYWDALRYSIENGHHSFDFGRCTLDSGTYQFKKQWGAKPAQLYWHYWLRSGGDLPYINHTNPKYRLFISLWKCLPLWFANWLGPKLIKHLP